MEKFESLSHVRWECKYHVVFIPKYRRKVMYGKLRSAVGQILQSLSTVGRDETTVRRYIREQENRDQEQGQLFN